MVNIRRVLVATDLSENSPRLYRVAIDMARPTNAHLIVVHVAAYQEYIETLREVQIGVTDYLAGLRSRIRQELRSVGRPDESALVEVMLQQDTVSADIRTLATLLDADLIIMGTHGRTGLRRALLGSVAEDVIRHAELPVLVVPMAAHRAVEQLVGDGVTRTYKGRSLTRREAAVCLR